jgi:dihydroorotate dehydrogenase (NAD+) catalytic subunit
MTQTYDIHQSYAFNYERGPVFPSAPIPDSAGSMKTFLGKPVRSRLGIAAGLLLNSQWVLGYAGRGFDILTYKTVRTEYRPCYDPPNWVFVETDGREGGPVYVTDLTPTEPGRITSAVCFGMPSMPPEVWREDVKRAKSGLGSGQLLVVSVVASPKAGDSEEAVAEDFRRGAVWAAEAGADVVEANFSCPNVCSAEGTVYMDSALSRRVAKAIREGIGPVPLLVKIGRLNETTALRALLEALAGRATGVTLVNGVTRPVLHRDGRPAFGPRHLQAGVLGRAIHEPSVAQVALASRIIREESLGLEIAAVGGVSHPGDMADFFAAGAQAVLMGSSPMYLPDLAAQAKALHPEW